MADDTTQTTQDNEEVILRDGAEQAPPLANTAGFDQESFIALKGLIQRLSVQLDETKEKKKEYQQRLKNILENDSQLAEFEEQAKEATLSLKKRKKELQETTEAKEIKSKIKEYNEEFKDLQESLTNSLLNYFQMTGAKSFDTPAGGEREFKLNARLMPEKDA